MAAHGAIWSPRRGWAGLAKATSPASPAASSHTSAAARTCSLIFARSCPPFSPAPRTSSQESGPRAAPSPPAPTALPAEPSHLRACGQVSAGPCTPGCLSRNPVISRWGSGLIPESRGGVGGTEVEKDLANQGAPRPGHQRHRSRLRGRDGSPAPRPPVPLSPPRACPRGPLPAPGSRTSTPAPAQQRLPTRHRGLCPAPRSPQVSTAGAAPTLPSRPAGNTASQSPPQTPPVALPEPL